jgi:hypothetical protein
MTGQENTITAGFQLTSIACPGCDAVVPVECGDLTGLPGSGLGDMVAVAQDLARGVCPAYPGNPPHGPVYLVAGPVLPRYEFSISTWTPEQMEVFKAKLDALMRSDVARRLAVRLLPPAKPVSPVTHIAGAQVQIGSHLRQRCSWCGVILGDYDLDRIAVPDGQDPRPGLWETGKLVHVDGPLSRIVAHEDGAELPADACAAAELGH